MPHSVLTSDTVLGMTTLSPGSALHQGWLAASKGVAGAEGLAEALQTRKPSLALARRLL